MNEPLDKDNFAKKTIAELLNQMGYGRSAIDLAINPISISIFNKAYALGFEAGYSEE